jgi:hypothetical protein
MKHMDFRHIWPRGTAQQYEPQACISTLKTEHIKKTGKKNDSHLAQRHSKTTPNTRVESESEAA